MPDPTPALTADQVRRIARLARLALDEGQVERYRTQLSAVLGYVQRLGELDLRGVEPMPHVGGATNRLDPDEPGPTLTPEQVARLAPESMEGFIKVPKVLDEGAGA